MTRTRSTVARLLSIGTLSAAALLGVAGSGPAALADVPGGWVPGETGFQADFGDARWVHEGFYAGQPGNWHSGWVNVEEDDDGFHATLIDWRCPEGARPPTMLDWRLGQTYDCTAQRMRFVEFLDYDPDIGVFNQKRDRLLARGEYAATDENGEPAGTVRVDLKLTAVGEPQVTRDITKGKMFYEEYWPEATLSGKIDGRGVGGHGTTVEYASTSFWVMDYVRG